MAVVEKVKDTRVFLEESWTELQKVTWPDRDQLQNATLVVIAFTIAISLVIWLMDGVVRFVLNQIMGIFGA
ncbi:MAG TPA: preprotein translocase subunit SecE [Candidatus Krumholzibacterium sp.]|nr:preprotein translocase subunit SecE [Longimicrobiales bacterium]HSG27745.1 preprotein translocase subunit SecE [Candidatus Krumholzibacterium sp.]